MAREEPTSFAAVARHVTVLETAGLVRREVRGRDHWLTLEPAALDTASAWIRAQTDFWTARADALETKLARRRRQR